MVQALNFNVTLSHLWILRSRSLSIINNESRIIDRKSIRYLRLYVILVGNKCFVLLA